MFDELQLAISKHTQTSMAMELSFPNEFTLGADESTCLSETSELSILIKYVKSITNSLCERFLRLVSLKSSKTANALREAIAKVFRDQNLNIKNIFSTLSTELTRSIGGLQSILKVHFRNISIAGASALLLCLFTLHKSMKF